MFRTKHLLLRTQHRSLQLLSRSPVVSSRLRALCSTSSNPTPSSSASSPPSASAPAAPDSSGRPRYANSEHATVSVVRPPPLPVAARGDVPPNIWDKTNARLHATPGHPLSTLRCAIEAYVTGWRGGGGVEYAVHTDLSPVVTAEECFDNLLVAEDHVSRSPSDTYYIDAASRTRLLRTHMTAHDGALIRSGVKAAVSTGDVYRRDSIDRTHYPVFHQVDAFRLYEPEVSRGEIEADLKGLLEGLAKHLFGQSANTRWVDAHFPFTTPSFELEVEWKGEWLELLGCGLLHRDVLSRAGVAPDVNGWAFGLGLERIAMVLFDIPDIRLFWSTDPRFTKQFQSADLNTRFKPFSVYPHVEKHVSFWVDGPFHDNDLCQIARAVGGDLVEHVERIDTFTKGSRVSHCFSVVFRSLHRSLTHVEVNEIYERLRQQVAATLPVTLR